MTAKVMLTILFLTEIAAAFSQKTGKLTINAHSFRNNIGLMRYALYVDKKTFMDDEKYFINGFQNIENRLSSVTITIPEGEYAVTILHDEDKNEKMGFSWLGIPSEGFGISNVTSFPFKKPAFEKCLIKIEAGKIYKLDLKVHYSIF
jgi:uncharacterized protein (DUF2141 family)